MHAQLQVSELQAQHKGLIGVEGDYAQLMGSSRFCLVPRGQSAWTRRAFESFFSGCVPVLLSDHVELPFESSIDYSKMTIKWPADRIDSSLVRKCMFSISPSNALATVGPLLACSAAILPVLQCRSGCDFTHVLHARRWDTCRAFHWRIWRRRKRIWQERAACSTTPSLRKPAAHTQECGRRFGVKHLHRMQHLHVAGRCRSNSAQMLQTPCCLLLSLPT